LISKNIDALFVLILYTAGNTFFVLLCAVFWYNGDQEAKEAIVHYGGNGMEKLNSKPFLVEALYLLGLTLAAAGAAWIQFVQRVYVGDYSGFITSGKIYRYSDAFYRTGFVLFLCVVIITFRFFYKQKLEDAAEKLAKQRVFYFLIAFLLSLVMFAVLFLICFLLMGESVRMEPEWELCFTVFGWPIGIFIYMVVVGILFTRKH